VEDAFDEATDENLAKLKRRCRKGFLYIVEAGDLVVEVAVPTERSGLGVIMCTFCP